MQIGDEEERFTVLPNYEPVPEKIENEPEQEPERVEQPVKKD